MAEQVVPGHTRGQYGRGLELDKITEIQGHTFVCPQTENLLVLLKNDKKYVVNGEVISEPAKYAQFLGHRFATKDDEIAEMLRKSSPFLTGKIKELGDAKEEAADAKIRKALEAVKSDPAVLEAIRGELMKDAKAEEPKVSARKKTSK